MAALTLGAIAVVWELAATRQTPGSVDSKQSSGLDAILAAIQQQQGNPDAVEILEAQPIDGSMSDGRVRVKFRHATPLGTKVVSVYMVYMDRGRVQRALAWR